MVRGRAALPRHGQRCAALREWRTSGRCTTPLRAGKSTIPRGITSPIWTALTRHIGSSYPHRVTEASRLLTAGTDSARLTNISDNAPSPSWRAAGTSACATYFTAIVTGGLDGLV